MTSTHRKRSATRVFGLALLTAAGYAASAPCALADGGQAALMAIGAAASPDKNPSAVDAAGENVVAEAKEAKPPAGLPILFAPRANHGAPALREGGATRGTNTQLVVSTLVPEFDAAAVTLAEQPVLHWHLSTATAHPVNFTLVDPEGIDPLIDVTFEGPFEAGFQTIDLASQDARLEVGKRYEWYVAVVPDASRRSADTIARGSVLRIEEPELLERVSKADAPSQAASMLAASGIWYDALDSVRSQMAAAPKDVEAQAQWTALLEQVNLDLSE